MRRGRIFFYLAAILILVLGAAFVIGQRFLSPAPSTPAEGAPAPTPVVDLVQVVVVTQPISRGAELDETVLGMIEIPRDVLIEGMFTEIGLAVGRQAKFDLDSGIPLTASMLVDSAEQLSSTGSLAALSIPRGKVAISIPIDRMSSVSYAPRPGDHVGVIATMLFVDIDTEFQAILPNQVGGVSGPSVNPETGASTITISIMEGTSVIGRTELDPILNELTYVLPSEKQRPRLVSQFILYNVEVLQVGNFLLEAEEEAAAEAEQAVVADGAVEGQQPAPPAIEYPTIITLIVDPQDAVALNYLLFSETELTLVLRASGDDTPFTTEAATLQFMLDVYNVPAPAKLPYSMEPRIDSLSDSPPPSE
jgi:Flp pilus assembly protein CpaB